MPFEEPKFERSKVERRKIEIKEIKKWFDSKREEISEIYSEIYKKIFPERKFSLRFLDSEAFLKICREKNLFLPPWKRPEEELIHRLSSEDKMEHLFNQDALVEVIRKEIEREKKEGKTAEEIAESMMIGLITHEIRHDVQRKKPDQILTEEALSGGKELQEVYKKAAEGFEKAVKEGWKDWEKELKEQGWSEEEIKKEISKEADAEIVETIVRKGWGKGLRDIELISKIIDQGDASKLGETFNLLEKEEFTPETFKKIQEIYK